MKPAVASPRVAWLYLSAQDIAHAESLIAAFKEDDAADSLGLRRLNGVFSDWLYPGLTTPMTRTRYFIFIPTMMRSLQQQRHKDAKSARESSKAQQLLLRNALSNLDGNIGRKAGEKLQRWPT